LSQLYVKYKKKDYRKECKIFVKMKILQNKMVALQSSLYFNPENFIRNYARKILPYEFEILYARKVFLEQAKRNKISQLFSYVV
jgi:hypothetical protein